MENSYNDEITIDLMDMLFALLKKWRSLVVLLLCGALLGGALSFLPAKELDPKDLKEDKLFNMERAAQLRGMYNQWKQITDESVLTQMHTNSIFQGSVKYYVQDENDINQVMLTCQNILQDYQLRQDLWAASGFAGDVTHIDEVASSSVYQVSDNKGDNSTTALSVEFDVTAGSVEACEEMTRTLKAAMNTVSKNLTQKYGDCTVELIGDSVKKVNASGNLDIQRANADRLNSYLAEIQKLENGFSDEEMAYYKAAFPVETEEEEVEAGLGKYLKPVIIGAFLGCVLWGMWQVVAYFVGGKIKTAKELPDNYRVPLLGRVQAGAGTAKGIDGWLEGLQEKTRPQPVTVDYLAGFVAAMDCGEAVLCGDRACGAVAQVMDGLARSHQGLQTGDFLSGSAEALSRVKQAGSEILVVQAGVTKRVQVQRELENCRIQGVKVLGAVVIG